MTPSMKTFHAIKQSPNPEHRPRQTRDMIDSDSCYCRCHFAHSCHNFCMNTSFYRNYNPNMAAFFDLLPTILQMRGLLLA